MQITLEKDLETFVEEQVRSGAFPSATALVNDALRALSAPRERSFEVNETLEAWLLESASGPTTPLTRGDFAEIRKRVRDRRPASPDISYLSRN